MKIVMITHDTKIDRRIIHEAESLIKIGHDVKIIAFPWDGTEDDDTNVEIIRGKVAHVHRENRKTTYKIYKNFLKKVLPTRLLDGIRKLYDLLMLDYEDYYEGYLLDLVMQNPADVYHVHDLPSLSTGVKAAQKYNAKLVYDSHELFIEQGFTMFNKMKWKNIEKKYIKYVDHIITVNESIAEQLSRTYHINKPSVIMNKTKQVQMVDREEVKKRIRMQYNISYDASVVLYQGGIVDSRNLIKLIDIINYCKQPWKLIFLGSGEYKSHLKEYAKGNSNIMFIDEVSQGELLEHTVGLADVGIIPYEGNCLNNYYCTPNKLFEFIACGIPIVTNNLPEVNKVVEKNEIGRVVDINDIPQAASVLNEILKKKELLDKYKKNIEKIQYEFSWTFEEKRLLKIYNEL